jgi:precorrin isomerase
MDDVRDRSDAWDKAEQEVVATGEVPTALLRWHNGILEQKWVIHTHRAGRYYAREVKEEWRKVPVVDDHEDDKQ